MAGTHAFTLEGQSTRRAILGAGAVGAAAVAAACGGPSGQESVPQAGKAPVTIKAFIGGLDAAMLNNWEREIAEPLKQQRPNTTLQLINQAAEIGGITTGGTLGVVEKLVAMIAGGEPPDLNDLPRQAAWQVQQGFLDDQMDGFVKRDKYDTKQFNQKEFTSRAMYQGKVWQIPFKHGGNSLVLMCNRALFQAENIPIPGTDSRPWDWNAFVETLNRLTRRSGSTTTQFGLFNYGWYLGTWPLLWQTDWVTADGKTITCDSADMQDCYSKFADLFHRHRVIPKPGEAAELFGPGNTFLLGKTAMAISAAGSWRTYVTQDQVADLALAPMPKVKITTPDINTHSLGIIKGSKNQADAWEVIKYLNDGGRLARFTDRLPAALSAIEPWTRDQLKRFPNADPKVVLRAVETHVPQINLGAHKWQDDMMRVLNPALDGLVQGKEAPVPMLTRLKPELQAIANRP
jgi:ABC-type glycerol-3-phosphate transport system substrate-binding protein